jgi:hypothetical protein
MVYTELHSFMGDVFKGRGNDICTQAMSTCGIIDIDMATKDQRKQFADYLLKNHINFSPQRNRYLYEHLLNILKIGGLFSLQDYNQTVTHMQKKEDSIVLSSLTIYWQKIERSFYKYEVILNLFWLKGVEAELQGTDRGYVMRVIRQAFTQIKEDVNAALQELLEDLDLIKFKERRHSFLKIQLFSQDSPSSKAEPGKEENFLIGATSALHESFLKSFSEIEKMLLRSLETDRELRSHGKPDKDLIDKVKANIIAELETMENRFRAAYKIIEEKIRR